MTRQQFAQTSPPELTRLAASGEPLLPYPLDLVGVPSQPTTVARDTVIGKVSPHHTPQVEMLLADCEMQVVPAPVAHRRQRTGKPALCRGLPNYILALLGPTPYVSEAKEVERGAVRIRMAYAPRPMKAKVDEVRLVRVEREPKAGKTLAQHRQNALGVDKSVERHHRIIGEADQPGRAGAPTRDWSGRTANARPRHGSARFSQVGPRASA